MYNRCIHIRNKKEVKPTNPDINLRNTDINFSIDNLDISISQILRGVFNESFVRHSHGANYYEFHLICEGKGQLLVGDDAYNLTEKTLFVTGPMIEHEQLTDKVIKMSEYCIGAIIKPKKNSTNSEFSELLLNTKFWLGTDRESQVLNLFRIIAQESNMRQIGRKTYIESLIKMIMCSYVRSYSNNKIDDSITQYTPDSRRMMIIDHCFLTRYNTLTELELCQEVNLSRRQLQRFLHKYYGKTFTEMRQISRINKAEMLLSQGYDYNEVADLVGYNDGNYLRKIKNHTKKS